SRNQDWVDVTLDLGDGRGPRPYRRETNTMPNWAGSCWYELRYLDPHNSEKLVDPEIEQYWMGPRAGQPHGGVDLYVGGAEHAVTPEAICEEYGADTLRLYEMAMGPLDVSRPWDTRAVVGQYRLLQRLWRNVVDEATGEVTVVDAEPDETTLRALHKAIDGVR